MKLKVKEVTYEITVDQDDISVRGNAMASGDEQADRECEDAILRRLDVGDVWAWAHVIVTARWKGYAASDSLGGCSYRDENDFRACGYFEDMKAEALARLKAQIPKPARRWKKKRNEGESVLLVVACVDGKVVGRQSCTVPSELAEQIALFALVQAEDPDLDLAWENLNDQEARTVRR